MKSTFEGNGMRVIVVSFVVLSLVAANGCSISKSLSNSISSPSKSSSGGGDDSDKVQSEKSYLNDVTQIGVTYAKNGGDIGGLRSAVSQLATARGMTNWEVDAATRKAIGEGVGEGGMTAEEFDTFAKDLFGDDLAKVSSLRSGYAEHAPEPKDDDKDDDDKDDDDDDKDDDDKDDDDKDDEE
jgi:hypothetical protein